MMHFWLSIFPLPNIVIKHIVYICRNFLWIGDILKSKSALVAWSPRKKRVWVCSISKLATNVSLLSSCGTSTSKLILSGYSGFIIITFSVSLFGMLSLYEPLRQYESLLSLLRTSLLQTVVASTKLLH